MCALVLDCCCNKSEKSPIGCNNICPMIRFRLLLWSPGDIDFETEQPYNLSIYCSETGQWTETISLVIPFNQKGWQSWHREAVVSNRVAYWLLPDDHARIHSIVAVDLFKGTDNPQGIMRLVQMPIGIGLGWRAVEKFAQLGLVRGQLRMSQLTKVKNAPFALKVWELIYDEDGADVSSKSWHLVHDVKVDMVKTRNVLYVIALHPENGNVLFILCGFDIYLYEIAGLLNVSPLVHPSLGPTQIPEIPELIQS